METIRIDCSQKGERYEKYWCHCVGAGRANEGMRAGWREHLLDVVKNCGFKYLRFHGLLSDDMMIYHEDEAGNPIYNWQYIDELFDFMLDAGIRPFVEFGFMPGDLKSGDMTVFWWKGNVTPPKDINRWGELIGNCAMHWIERYGLDEVRRWYFEIWNEANLDELFFSGTQADYFRMYESAVKALKAVDEKLRVGGPATSSFENGEAPWVKDFLKYCDANKLPADFISTHPYPVTHPKDEKTGEILDEFRESGCGFADLTWLKKAVAASKYPKAEIHLTEWNSSPRPRDFVHDHPFAGAFIIKNNIECIGLCDSLSYWTFTDVFEETRAGDTPFHGGFGMITFQGIHKPAYHAYSFLNRLGEFRLGQGEGWFATKDKKGDIRILIWNYDHYTNPDARIAWDKDTVDELFTGGETRKFEFQLDGLGEGNHRLTISTVDMENASAFHAWKKMGAPDWLTKKQVKRLKSAATPVVNEYPVGTVTELPAHSFALIDVVRGE